MNRVLYLVLRSLELAVVGTWLCVVSLPANAQGAVSGAKPVVSGAKPAAPANQPATPGGGGGSISSNSTIKPGDYVKSGPSTINPEDYVTDGTGLKLRVDYLERRVLELEKDRVNMVARDNDNAASRKQLEQRLAAIESAQRDDAAKDSSGDEPEASHKLDSQVVRAPFVVVDADGNRLLTIDRSEKSKGARLTVGDPKGAAVVLGATGDSAVIQLLTDQTGAPKVGIVADPGHQGIKANGPNGSIWVGSSNEKVALVQVLNKAGYPVAEMRGMPDSQGGQMSIANASGNKLMIVQETTKGVGILRMGPSNYGMAPAMQNQGLPGGGLTGKKD